MNEGRDGFVAARQDSPLIVGHGVDGYFLASDLPAFVKYTHDITFLEDGDIAHITDGDGTVTNGGLPVKRAVHTVEWAAKTADNGGCDH